MYSPERSRSSSKNISLLGLGLPWNQSLQHVHPTNLNCLVFLNHLPEHHHCHSLFDWFQNPLTYITVSYGSTMKQRRHHQVPAMARSNHLHRWTPFRSSSPPCRIPSDHGTGDCVVPVGIGEDVYVRWRWHGYSHGIAEFMWRNDGSGGDSCGGIASSSYSVWRIWRSNAVIWMMMTKYHSRLELPFQTLHVSKSFHIRTYLKATEDCTKTGILDMIHITL